MGAPSVRNPQRRAIRHATGGWLMGANLVGRVLSNWTHVSDRAFRVLVRMAHTALDHPKEDTPADHYFAGRELLAMTLRATGGTEQSRYRVVARVVAELIEVGAIERIDSGRTGHSAVYRLTLGDACKPARKPKKGGQSSHPQGGQISHPKGGQFDQERVADLATPRNQEEPIEELREEEVVDLTTTSRPLRATEPSEPAPVIPLFPGTANAPGEPPYLNRSPWHSRRDHGADTVTAAMERQAAKRLAHQAQLASGETT
jgi:hypothetical protein